MDKTRFVSVRLDEDDRLALETLAQDAGLSKSAWVRSLLHLPESARRQDTVYVVDGKTLAKLALELIRQGRNHNQAVRALNTLALWARNGRAPAPADMDARLELIGKRLAAIEESRLALESAVCEIADSVTVRG